jgi:hypothetical protein
MNARRFFVGAVERDMNCNKCHTTGISYLHIHLCWVLQTVQIVDTDVIRIGAPLRKLSTLQTKECKYQMV